MDTINIKKNSQIIQSKIVRTITKASEKYIIAAEFSGTKFLSCSY